MENHKDKKLMVLGFQKQFVTKILDGTKIHTIREDKYCRWREGRLMHMATGVRLKTYKCFAEKICTGVQNIEIGNLYVIVDGTKLSFDDIWLLASSDGFNSLDAFYKWFFEYPLPFHGKLIHWTNKRY